MGNKMIGVQQAELQDIHLKRVFKKPNSIIECPGNPLQKDFNPLPSGCRIKMPIRHGAPECLLYQPQLKGSTLGKHINVHFCQAPYYAQHFISSPGSYSLLFFFSAVSIDLLFNLISAL